MSNSEKYWSELSKRIKSPVETKNKRPDTSDLEIEFLNKHLNKSDDVLDIGTGSGLIVNKLFNNVNHITAVEKFEGFTKFILDTPKILVINAELNGFKMRKKFDAILSFGVSQCFSLKDIRPMYESFIEMLKPNGKLIIRMQCGIEKGKIVDGFSEELQTNYFADYRHWEFEKQLLEEVGFKNIQLFDIFPDTLNVWPDTRHYLFVCNL